MIRRLAPLAFVLLAGCGATTYDDSRLAPTTTPTTTLPSGTASELLPRLEDEMGALSTLIGPRPDDVEQPGVTKRDHLAAIEALWAAVAPEVTAADPESAETIDRMVALARGAVEKNRPADADKAAKFVAIVIDRYLQRNG